MSSKIIHSSNFYPDECGAFTGKTGDAQSPIYFGLQKGSINTVDNFCYSPFGQVSNIDCPDWDPACNCYIAQYRPNKPLIPDKELIQLKLATNECQLIQKVLPDLPDYGGKDKTYFGWWGIDFNNHRCPYNCKNDETPENPGFLDPRAKPVNKRIQFFGITGDVGASDYIYPYSLGLSGTSGAGIYSKDHVSSRDDINPYTKDPESDAVDPVFDYNDVTYPDGGIGEPPQYPRINGPLFKYYLEYSKTNATFWNTPPKTPLLRAAYMALYRFQQIRITVNGNYNVKIGSLINILMPIRDELRISNPNSQLTNKRFAGSWMVYRIERIINSNKHSMNLYLMRDGFNTNSYSNPVLNKYGDITYRSTSSETSKKTY